MSEELNQEENKGIFKYFDGESEVHADPFELDYKFMKISQDKDMKSLDSWLEPGPENEPEAESDRRASLFMEACHQLDPIIRKTFDIKPFDKRTGKGLLLEDVMKLYYTYMEWRYIVKKNSE